MGESIMTITEKIIVFILILAGIIICIDKIANFISLVMNKNKTKELEKQLNKIIEDKDIESLMIKNVIEIKEYYVISKKHANKVFWVALLSCFGGIGLFAYGIWVSYRTNNNILVWTTMSGTIVELISGLSFFLYKITLNQLNLYHNRLGFTERYLIAMKMVEKIKNSEQKDNLCQKMMECVLIDNRTHKENNINYRVHLGKNKKRHGSMTRENTN